MRNYSCYYEALEEKKWVTNENTACWAGIKNYDTPKLLRISYWQSPHTKHYAQCLVNIINKITPCYIVDDYIYFQMLGGLGQYAWYDRNLVLLNFIRYLWNTDGASFVKDNLNKEYVTVIHFFKALAKSRYKDPFKRLSKANAVYSDKYFEQKEYEYAPGHSNIQKGNKILSTAEFLNNTNSASKFFK